MLKQCSTARQVMVEHMVRSLRSAAAWITGGRWLPLGEGACDVGWVGGGGICIVDVVPHGKLGADVTRVGWASGMCDCYSLDGGGDRG